MINKGIRKIDSTAIVTGKPLYTEDLIMHKDVLTLKLLRSPHAHAKIKNIDTSKAEKFQGLWVFIRIKMYHRSDIVFQVKQNQKHHLMIEFYLKIQLDLLEMK